MLEMFKHHLKRHKYKIVVGLPMAVLLASSLSFVRDPAEVCIVPEDNRYVTVGEEVTLFVTAQADEPINVIGATLRIPDTLTVESLSKEGSMLTLWTEEPLFADGVVHFSGGFVGASGFVGIGTALTLKVRPNTPGTTLIDFEDVHMLAHDGTGQEVACTKSPTTLIVRAPDTPSPDVNNDARVNIFDLGLVSANILLSYQPLYDLNNDGAVSFSDLGLMLRLMRQGV